MAIEKIYLDPNAAAYTDDEIVGKVNAAAAQITRIDAVDAGALQEGETFVKFLPAEAAKLGNIQDGAEVNPTATDIRDSIVGLPDDDRQVVLSRPTTGQKKIYAVQTHTDGKTELEQSDTPES